MRPCFRTLAYPCRANHTLARVLVLVFLLVCVVGAPVMLVALFYLGGLREAAPPYQITVVACTFAVALQVYGGAYLCLVTSTIADDNWRLAHRPHAGADDGAGAVDERIPGATLHAVHTERAMSPPRAL